MNQKHEKKLLALRFKIKKTDNGRIILDIGGGGIRLTRDIQD